MSYTYLVAGSFATNKLKQERAGNMSRYLSRAYAAITLSFMVIVCLFNSPLYADEFVPTSPCRIVDTRNTSALPILAGVRLDFKVRNYYASGNLVSPGSGQGGSSGCGIPTTATSVFLSVVAINPSANGHITLWAFGTTQPISSSMNVSAGETENNGLFGLIGTGAYDLSLKAAFLAAHYVVDVSGYTIPSLATLVGQATGTLSGEVLVIRTAGDKDVKVYAPNSLSGFKQSWKFKIEDAVDRCTRIDGYWTDGNTSGEGGLFEARSLPFTAEGYCGPIQVIVQP